MMLRMTVLLFLVFTSCNRSDSIDEFVGNWETKPFSEVMDDALSEEMIPAIRAGTFPEFEELRLEDPEDYEEFISKSDEELKRSLSKPGLFRSMGVDLRFGFEITSDSRFRFVLLVDDEVTAEEEWEAEFQVLNDEILVRTDEETMVIYIEPDHLRMRNEERDKYPTYLRCSVFRNPSIFNDRQYLFNRHRSLAGTLDRGPTFWQFVSCRELLSLLGPVSAFSFSHKKARKDARSSSSNEI